MTQVTPIDEFCQGRLGLPELLTQIERTFSSGDGAEQTALLDSWRKNELKNVLDQRVSTLIDEKIETEYSKSQLRQVVEDKTVILPSPIALRPGSVLKGRFILEEVLGSGGMGVVYRAIDLRKKEAQDRDPSIAIKVLNEDFRKHPDSFRALQREARKAQTLAHPNIITVYDFDREDALIYLTMEYLSGASLEKSIKARKGPLPLDQVVTIIKPVCAALAFAHENGIVHSDLKPANIFITEAGRVKVIDFGIARAVKRSDQPDSGDTTMFDPGQLRALTPAYASIEMIEGREPDIRDDIYALGCITYELVAGRHPYGRIMATQALSAEITPKKPEALNARQWRVLSSAISLDRETRTASVNRFAEDFFASESTPTFTPLRMAGAAAFVAIVAAAVLLYAVNPFRSAPPGNAQQAIIQPEPAPVSAPPQIAQAVSTPPAADTAKAANAQQAADAAKQEADRRAAADAKQEADRQAAAAARLEADRQAAADAAKKEADRQAAAEAAKKEADRQAATDAAKKEADRQAAADAAKKEADRKAAADATKKVPQRTADASVAPASPAPNIIQQTAAITPPRLNTAAVIGAWCAGSMKINLSQSDWRFQLAGGAETKLAVTKYVVADDKILVYSTDNRDRESVTEFGNFSGDQMTQIRGRLLGDESWNSYNRVFKKC